MTYVFASAVYLECVRVKCIFSPVYIHMSYMKFSKFCIRTSSYTSMQFVDHLSWMIVKTAFTTQATSSQNKYV